jgi:GNAT superfamily N-acetyltransferase
MIVRAVTPSDELQWRRLWADYCRFYAAKISDEITCRTWERILEPNSALLGRMAESAGEGVIGFSISVIHEGTWTGAPVCYLEDLFVASMARGAGVGTALILDLIDLARKNEWSRLYWHTHKDNAAARRLYDRFGEADGFVRYRLFFD